MIQRHVMLSTAYPRPRVVAASSLCSVDIPDNLGIDDFVGRYDSFVASACIPALGYTTDVFSGPEAAVAPVPNNLSSSGSDGSDSDSERGPAVAWPGQGTSNREDPNFLPPEPREDDYYLQFCDLTPVQFGVEGYQRCWVSHRGSRVKAVVVETYFLLCQINKSSSGKTRRPKEMILYYSVADRDGKYMGYVSSGRVRLRYTGWKLDEYGDRGSQGERVIKFDSFL